MCILKCKPWTCGSDSQPSAAMEENIAITSQKCVSYNSLLILSKLLQLATLFSKIVPSSWAPFI